MEEMLIDAKPAAYWTTQAFGLALISAALLILTTVGLILFGGEDTAFFGLMTAVAVVVTVVVWRFDNAWALSRRSGHPWRNGHYRVVDGIGPSPPTETVSGVIGESPYRPRVESPIL